MTRRKLFEVLAVAGLMVPACGDKANDQDTGPNTTEPSDETADDDADDEADDEAETAPTTADDEGTTAGEEGPDPSDSSGNASGNFIQDPDGNSINNECDIWAQDCPEGEKCMPWANDGGSSWNATRCSPLDPNPSQPGDPCTVEGSGVSGIDNCALSSMCWDVNPETNEGTCVVFCSGSEANPVCEDPTTQCVIANEGVLILCLPNCDPLIQDCPEGQACYPATDTFVCGPDAGGEAGAYGDGCEFVNFCDPGLFCANPDVVPNCDGAAGCCSEYCDLSVADPDAACSGAAGGQMCTPWYEEGQAPPGFEDVGACAIPA